MQQRNQLLKYVLDIESIIMELEQILSLHQTIIYNSVQISLLFAR
jgi:hypothetical protein